MENSGTKIIEIVKGNEYRILVDDIYDKSKIISDLGYEIFKTHIADNYWLAFSWDIQHYIEKIIWIGKPENLSVLSGREYIIVNDFNFFLMSIIA